jgi:hypothetical protein
MRYQSILLFAVLLLGNSVVVAHKEETTTSCETDKITYTKEPEHTRHHYHTKTKTALPVSTTPCTTLTSQTVIPIEVSTESEKPSQSSPAAPPSSEATPPASVTESSAGVATSVETTSLATSTTAGAGSATSSAGVSAAPTTPLTTNGGERVGWGVGSVVLGAVGVVLGML